MNSITSYYPRRLGDGDSPTAREWNMLVSQVYSTQDDTQLTTADVLRLSENSDPILARINSGDTPASGRRAYGWNFVNQDGDGAYRDTLHFGGGTTITSPAYEAAGRSDVPVDGTAIVWLRPGAGDYYEFSYAERPIWAKLTSGSGADYAWTEVYPSASETFSALSGGMSGTTTVNPAIERNGVTGVAADTIVRLERGFSSGAAQVAINRTQLGNGVDASEIYSIAILNSASGTFTITFEGETTSALTFDIDAATLETALEALSTLTDVEVYGTGTANDPFMVELVDDYDEHEIFEATSSLKGDQEWYFVSPVISATYDPVDGGTISTSQNDYPLEGTVTFFDIDTAINFTGFVAPGGGKSEVVYVKNVGSKVATFVHESASSTAANRFHCPTTSDYQLPPQSIGVFKYDTIGLRWQPVLNIPTYAAYTKSQITSNQNDYALSEYAHIYRLSTDASRTVTGFADVFPGRLLIVENVGSYDIVLANQSSSSTAANRIITGSGASLTLAADQCAFLVYDGATARWRVVAHTATVTHPASITSINSLTAAAQTLAVGTAGTDFAVSSVTDTHTFNLPYADPSVTGGKISNLPQDIGGIKYFVDGLITGDSGNSIGIGITPIVAGNGGCSELTPGAAGGPGSNIGYSYGIVFSNSLSAAANGGDYRSHAYLQPDVNSDTGNIFSPAEPDHAALNLGATFYDADGDDTGTNLKVYAGSDGYYVTVSGSLDAAYAVSWAGTTYKGASGTSGGGDTVKGGIITTLGTNPLTIGQPVGSGTSTQILIVDGSGKLDQSSDFTFDDSAKTLTLGSGGFVITTKTSAPSGIPTDSIAGPFFGS